MPGKAIKTGRKRALSEVSDSKKTKLAEGALDRLPRAKSQQKKSRTASKPLAPKTDEERELESLLFGGDGDEKIAQTILSNAGRELDMAGLSRQKPSSTKVDTVGQDGTHDGHSDEYEEGDDVLFFEDTGEVPKNTDAGDGSADIVSSANAIAKSTSNKTADTTRAAWHDKDDRKVKISLMGNNRTRKLRHIEGEDMMAGDQYERRLREQFEKVNPVPSWARKSKARAEDGGDGDNSDETAAEEAMDNVEVSFLKTSKSMISQAKITLPSQEIDIARLRNANQMAPAQAVVQRIQFHPTSSVILTAALDKTLRLFEVDGKVNQKVQSIYFKDMPIYNAQFISNGDEIVATGRRPFFYTVDVQRGTTHRVNGILGREEKSLERFVASPDGKTIAFPSNSGQIVLVSGKTKQWINTLQMNGTVKDVAWCKDSNYLWSIGMDAEVYQWDTRKGNECVQRWKDRDCYRPTCIASSPTSSFFACGDYSGIVNIYDSPMTQNDTRKPIKSVTNLTTPISEVLFNHDSQMLGIFSRNKKDQFKLVHLPSCTVFSNWPTHNTPLGYVQTFDFSPNSGFLGIGNDKGKVLLFRLKHYANY